MRKLSRADGAWYVTKRRANWRTYSGVWLVRTRHKNLVTALRDIRVGL